MYKILLALRYLLKRKITYFAIIAVTLCVFIVVIVMTVMAGLAKDFKERNYRFVGDCVVGTDSLVGFAYYEDFMAILEKQDFVEAISPVIKSFALVRSKVTNQDDTVEIMGIDPARHSLVTDFSNTLSYHKKSISKAFTLAYDPNMTGCIPGEDWLSLRGYYESKAYIGRLGFSISCFPLTSRGALAQAGTDLVDTKTFYCSDNFDSGLPRVNSALFYLPFDDVQRLCGMGGPTKRISWLHIKFKPDVNLDNGCEKVRSLWGEYSREKAGESQAYLLDTVSVQSWKQFRRETIAPMEQEGTLMSIMFVFVGITTVFIILVVFYMIISHKSKDIGILKSVGASSSDIIQLFSGFAFLVGLIGSIIGLFAGWLFLMNINRIEGWLFNHYGFQLWDRSMYAIGAIPNQVEFHVFLTIAVSAIIACLIGAFIPSRQAAKRKIVDTLQVTQL